MSEFLFVVFQGYLGVSWEYLGTCGRFGRAFGGILVPCGWWLGACRDILVTLESSPGGWRFYPCHCLQLSSMERHMTLSYLFYGPGCVVSQA